MLNLHLNVIGTNPSNRNNHPRYGFVLRPDPGSLHALYDIVDNIEGAERVLAYAVRYHPAIQIVGALNAQAEDHRVEQVAQIE